ncbi:MAG TPA: hypothetical protein VD994_05370 [Prosthecobacter sp.]|nr:hypothetical protein [Prosthecobacter sp.]
MVKLGQEVRDVITGFSGRITGLVDYLTGCKQALVAPRKKADGDGPDPMWFDVDRLEVTNVEPILLPSRTAAGADRSAPVR